MSSDIVYHARPFACFAFRAEPVPHHSVRTGSYEIAAELLIKPSGPSPGSSHPSAVVSGVECATSAIERGPVFGSPSVLRHKPWSGDFNMDGHRGVLEVRVEFRPRRVFFGYCQTIYTLLVVPSIYESNPAEFSETRDNFSLSVPTMSAGWRHKK